MVTNGRLIGTRETWRDLGGDTEDGTRGGTYNIQFRGHLEGKDAPYMRRLIGPTGVSRKGMLRHVGIHDLLSSKVDTPGQDTRRQPANHGADTDMSEKIVDGLCRVLSTTALPGRSTRPFQPILHSSSSCDVAR